MDSAGRNAPVTRAGESVRVRARLIQRLATPSTALALGGLAVALTIAFFPLAASDPSAQITDILGAPVLWLAFAAVGVVVARRQPRTVMSWLMLGIGLLGILNLDATLYEKHAYRHGHAELPLARVSIFLNETWVLLYLLLIPLVVLLFPDGRLPSPRWKWIARTFAGANLFLSAGLFLMTAHTVFWGTIRVTPDGDLDTVAHPTGNWAHLSDAGGIAAIVIALCTVSFVARQVVTWRRSVGARRQQQKWIVLGTAVTLAGLFLMLSGAADSVPHVVSLMMIALPASLGVAILRHRLYEIDRLVSRTLTYAIVTGLLVAAYLGVVTLTTRALPLSSPVGVAASTLVAAALFNPLRTRVQRLVDRRFNRARYDADATLAAFAAHLRDEVDLGSVESSLIEAVTGSLEPTHASLWIRAGDGASSQLA